MPDTELTAPEHPWFTIPGIQDGKYNLKQRIYALDDVRDHARGATVLDLGCAEGLISKWLIDTWGGKTVHGIDKYEPYAELARSLMRDYDAKYMVADFDFFSTWLDRNRAELLPRYDIVLALRVVQKLAKPVEFLKAVAPLVGKYFVIQVPANTHGYMVDHRSGNVPVKMETVMGPKFTLVKHQIRPIPQGHEFTGTFKRVAA